MVTGRVVVTGASGMLGGWVVRHLHEHGWSVYGLDLREPIDQQPGVDYTLGDVRDATVVRRALAGAQAVVHCAAALPSYAPDEIRSVIVEGTGTVFAAAQEVGLERVLHISTTAVYGLPTVVPTTEEYPRSPIDPYGHAKAVAEVTAERYRAAGLCVPILRPKTFVGPGRMGLFAMLFEWAEEGRNFPILGRGDVRIQMCAVEDLADCVRTVLAAPASDANDTYNVAAAEFGTLRQDFQAILDAAGHGKRVVSLPAGPAVAALRLLKWARLSPVYDRLIHKLLADSYVSTEKLSQRLGWQPRYSNQDALLRTFRWWRDERARGDPGRRAGRTSREPWSQGALRFAKVFF